MSVQLCGLYVEWNVLLLTIITIVGICWMYGKNITKNVRCPSHEFQQVFSIFNIVIKSHRIDDNKSISNNVTWQLVRVHCAWTERTNERKSFKQNSPDNNKPFVRVCLSFVRIFCWQSEIDWTHTLWTICNNMEANKQNMSSPTCRLQTIAFQ